MSKKPVALIIMDGFGHNPSDYGNAIHAAKKPNLDKYMQLGSWSHQHWCRQNRLPDASKDYKGY